MTNEYITSGLDYYKATMGQLEREHDAPVTFTLKNRSDKKLSNYFTPEELSTRLERFAGGWNPEEVAYLASIQNQDGSAQFSEEYLNYLTENPLPPVQVGYDEGGDISVSTSGPWAIATFWETVVMSEINELYFENKCKSEGTSLASLYEEGVRRLDEKIARLKERPDIKFSDFGTRRRFSYEWQRHVVERLAAELPDNFIGTSNIYLAHQLGLKPIGTFAHELPMVYAALADSKGENPLDSHNQLLRDWHELYKGDLSTALTDTFTSDFFFSDFTPEQARGWKALRHDSGDPIEFGEKAIAFYASHDINPLEKTIVFSDGLDIDTITALADHFGGRINCLFGWGTTLTNDLGLRPLNIVMKATEVNGVSTVKLSDDKGKHTGTPEKVEFYQDEVARRIGRPVVQEMVAL